MRKSFDGLCGFVSSGMRLIPIGGELFVFLNHSRTQIKLLHWEKGGFLLYYKQLEQGTFLAPKGKENEMLWSDLILMAEGIHVTKSVQKL